MCCWTKTLPDKEAESFQATMLITHWLLIRCATLTHWLQPSALRRIQLSSLAPHEPRWNGQSHVHFMIAKNHHWCRTETSMAQAVGGTSQLLGGVKDDLIFCFWYWNRQLKKTFPPPPASLLKSNTSANTFCKPKGRKPDCSLPYLFWLAKCISGLEHHMTAHNVWVQ